MIVPIFDGQYKQIELDQSLEHLDEFLPPFTDEIPSGSLALVAYTANAYYCAWKGGQSGWQRSQSNKNLALSIVGSLCWASQSNGSEFVLCCIHLYIF